MVICLCSIYQKTSFLNMKKYHSIRMIVTKKLLIYQSTKITVLYFKLPYVQLQKSRNNGHSVDYALQEDAY